MIYERPAKLNAKVKNEYRNHPAQRRSLHLWLSMYAEKLADAGVTMKVILPKCPEVNPTGILLKETVYKPMLEAIAGLGSTEDQYTTDVEVVRKEMERFFSEGWGVEPPPWPSSNPPPIGEAR